MRDKNFFEPYVGKKNSRDEKQKLVAIVAGGFTILILSYTLVNVIKIPMLKKEIARVTSELNENQLNEKKDSVEHKKELLAELQQIETEIDYVSLELNEKDKLGVYLVETITNSMPSDIFLKSIDINEEMITLEGISRTKEDIAQLEANLRQVIYFKEVFIPGINTEEGFYNFTITMNLTEEGVAVQEESEEGAEKSTDEDKDKKDENEEDKDKEEKSEDDKSLEDKEDEKDETK